MSEGEKPRPIYSTRADDLAYSDAIDRFVVGLAERVDVLQDAQSSGDLKQLAGLARGLAVDAAEVGYESLSHCATQVETACLAELAREAHLGVVQLTDLSQRVRLGHRGAA